MPGKAERDYASFKVAARHCVSLTKVASSPKFLSIKSSLSLLNQRLFFPVSPKVRAKRCEQNASLRFTKETANKKSLKPKKGAEEVGEDEQRGCGPALLSSLLFTVTSTLIISTMICKVFTPVGVCLFLHGLPAEQISRQQRVDWGGASHYSPLLSTRGSPQAGILLHATPQQLPACFCSARSQAAATAAAVAAVVVVPVGRVSDGMGGS